MELSNSFELLLTKFKLTICFGKAYSKKSGVLIFSNDRIKVLA